MWGYHLKVLVIESRNGRILESRIVEDDYFKVVKEVTREALEKWSPDRSDLVAVRDVWDIEVDETIGEELRKKFEELGLLVKEGSKEIAKIPVYTISYDNKMFSPEDYAERGLYMVVPYIDEELKNIFEAEAADLTSERKEPKGFIDLSN